MNKKIKELVSTALVLSMTASFITGCNSKTTDETEETEPQETIEETAEETEETTAETTETTESSASRPTRTPTPTPTPSRTYEPVSFREEGVPYELDMNEVAYYEQLYTDYVTTDAVALEIENDMVMGQIQLADALNGTVYVGVTYKEFYQDRDVYTGAILSDGYGRDLVVGEPFEADATNSWTGETRHISGYSLVDRTYFNEDGTLIIDDYHYNAWLEYDERHNAWYMEGFEQDDGVGFYTAKGLYGYVLAPISEDCELYFAKGGVYNFLAFFDVDVFGDEGQYVVDSLGNASVVEEYAMRFVPVNGSANVIRDFIDYITEYGTSEFMQIYTNCFFPEDYDRPYGDPFNDIMSSSYAYVVIEDGEITKIYFPWIPCGTFHWDDAANVLGTAGTGEFYTEPS